MDPHILGVINLTTLIFLLKIDLVHNKQDNLVTKIDFEIILAMGFFLPHREGKKKKKFQSFAV